ncbi:hypothetical protein B0I21_10725 [Sphingobacterium paludis]|uniref:Uncharacterized protein n=1 Tax=Sphingobacterium paludis TaxID=1476465 RepID=A0A4R7CX71_9SPHI|nr:hypothetical protein [Sphingobacterium paludis]TDS11684.1 hypothetical protein B0I21_10725 [Sphingobacterium paludis]
MRKQAKADHPETEATLLSNINGAFENMANGVNGASDAFEKKYNRR